jgi:peptidoglycan L-alanyl-D-glutamate endopeptidase CwlK
MAYVLGRKSLATLKGVHPDLVKVVKRAIEITEQDFNVACGLRTIEQQKVLVKTGKSKTMRSRHLTGHAVDLHPYPLLSWTDLKPFKAIVRSMKQAAKELKVPIVCGADWGWDYPHYELDRKYYP